uniref:CCHC-type domain-containing protein n=1 Tax=Trichogramma kaykai TaxID=54128 RepID=A0ABD2X824_9HYME
MTSDDKREKDEIEAHHLLGQLSELNDQLRRETDKGNLALLNKIRGDIKEINAELKKFEYLNIDLEKYQEKLTPSIKTLRENATLPIQHTPCTSRISNHSTPRITVEQIEKVVDSFIEDFRLELEETEAKEIEKSNIKEKLQETLVKYEQTQVEPEIEDGFFGKCYNKFLDFINVKREQNSTLFETVIQAPDAPQRSNLAFHFDTPDEDENQDMAARRGPSFKDILQLVPNFSGRDKEEANKFIKGCRLADELLEQNQKADFLKFIKVKLSGVALECINPTALASIAALTEFVEKNFGTRKLFFECYGDLSKLKQGKNEGVLTFFSRLKDLQRVIEAAARRENKHNAAFEASLLADLLTAFKRGLRWEIKSQLTANNLEEARDEAARIEREDGFDADIDAISAYKSRRACCTICDSREHSTIDCNSLASLHKSKTDKCSYCHSPDHYLTNCMKFTVDTKEKESCSHCGSTEHHVNNCMKFAQRDKESVKKEKEPEVITINHISAPICSVCSNKGHTASACNEFLSIMRNLINNSNNNNNDDCNNEFEINAINLASTITCGYCARKGHPASTCNDLLNAMRGFASKNNQTNNYSNKGDRRTEVQGPQQQQQQLQRPRQRQRKPELGNEPIYHISARNPSPTIRIDAYELNNPIELMLDTGAAVSVIKNSEISREAMVNFNKTILLRGITNRTIRSIGETVICLNNEIPITFQVVDSDFPIKQGGILGTKFFANNKGIINYKTNTLRFGGYSIPFHMQYLAEEDEINTFEARTQDNVRRETAYNDKQNRTQDNVRRETTHELGEQIATYKEHTLTRDEEYRVSAELNDGRAEPSQQIDERKENSRPSAGASRRDIELLCEQVKECNAYLRASREVHKDKKGRDNKRIPGDTEKINKSNNNELADETTDKKEKPSTKKAECIEKKERYDEETTCEDSTRRKLRRI